MSSSSASTRSAPRIRVAAVVLAGLLALPGCGLPGQSTATTTPPATTAAPLPAAAELMERAHQAALKAKSVRIKGEVFLDGKVMHVESAGDIAGTWTKTDLRIDEAEANIIVVDRSGYVKGNEAFLVDIAELPTAQADAVAGKWIKYKGSEQAEFTTKALIDKLFAEDLNSDARTVREKVDDHEVLVAEDAEYRYYVLTDGTDRPLKIDSVVQKGTLAFIDWDSITAPSAPPTNQTIAPPRVNSTTTAKRAGTATTSTR